jgi:ribosomal-protein-alanine N-acetyltransferase
VTVPPDAETTAEVRPAERADLLAVLRIERQSFPQPWPYEAFQRFLDTPGFLVAVDDANRPLSGNADDDENPLVQSPVVGYVVADVVRSRGQPIGHIKNLAVHPDRRGAGFGSALLERALEVLSVTETVKLEVRASNDGARSLYRRFGFERFRRVEGYYRNGEDALVMIREGDSADGLEPGDP